MLNFTKMHYIDSLHSKIISKKKYTNNSLAYFKPYENEKLKF